MYANKIDICLKDLVFVRCGAKSARDNLAADGFNGPSDAVRVVLIHNDQHCPKQVLENVEKLDVVGAKRLQALAKDGQRIQTVGY